MLIPIFSYDRYRLKTDTNISINTDADTDMVLADTDMIETDTDISVSAKNISQPIYRSISSQLAALRLSLMFIVILMKTKSLAFEFDFDCRLWVCPKKWKFGKFGKPGNNLEIWERV